MNDKTWTSELCTYDLATAQVRTVLRTDRKIEAPNWTPDGAALIVNGGGLLFKVLMSAPELVEINTGFARTLNNDHGVSPGGRTLAISDKTEAGQSRIYLLPVDGGTPKPVVADGPAYWHGWSPDGKRLAYVAKRNTTFQVCTCPVDGGHEVQVTNDFDHCDGPDYSSDGRWLWFNGEKDGAVDLWRVPVNGGEPERMTDDRFVNWFPHPSPEGDVVLYLAYPPGTQGHPADLEVSLRLLDERTGELRTVVELFGGQGSINVPCWSSDGSQFAFVRYG